MTPEPRSCRCARLPAGSTEGAGRAPAEAAPPGRVGSTQARQAAREAPPRIASPRVIRKLLPRLLPGARRALLEQGDALLDGGRPQLHGRLHARRSGLDPGGAGLG
eukprot:3799802-Pyramimonas_sp.AAC.1